MTELHAAVSVLALLVVSLGPLVLCWMAVRKGSEEARVDVEGWKRDVNETRTA